MLFIRNRSVWACLLTCGMLLFANAASALPPPTVQNPYQPLPGSDGGSILKGIEQQLPSIEQQLPRAKPPEAPKETKKPVQEEVRVTVQGFVFVGNTQISTADLNERVAEFVGKTMTLSELQAVADSIAALYQQRGMLASVTLPPQEIKDGIIKVKVVEARLGGVKVDTPNGPSRFGAGRARSYIFGNQPQGEILHMRRVERSVYILNETPGVAVATSVEPGAKDGDVNLNLQLADTPMFHAKVEANNQNSIATGVYQGLATLFLDNPQGVGDQLVLSGTYSDGSHYGRLEYTRPVTEDGLRINLYISQLDYRNVGGFGYPNNPNAGYGYAQTEGFNLTYAWIRDGETNLNASFTMDYRQFVNRMISTDFYTSEYSLSDMSVSISGNHYDGFGGGGLTNASLTLTSGQFSPGSDNPANYGLYTPRNFAKGVFSVNREQQLIPGVLTYNPSLMMQLASADLDSAEKIYLGGPDAVRAYPLSQAGGSQGVVFTNEIRQKFPAYKLTAIGFVDAGWIEQYRSDATYAVMKGNTGADNMYRLYGVGAGLSYQDQALLVSATVARAMGENPLHNSYGQALNNDNRSPVGYVWVKVSYQF